MNWLDVALDAVAAGEPAVLVTVAEAKGSGYIGHHAPRLQLLQKLSAHQAERH